MSGVLPWLHEAIEWGMRHGDNADDIELTHDSVRDALAPFAHQLAEHAEGCNAVAAALASVHMASPEAVIEVSDDGSVSITSHDGTVLDFDFERLALALSDLAELLGHIYTAGRSPRKETVQ